MLQKRNRRIGMAVAGMLLGAAMTAPAQQRDATARSGARKPGSGAAARPAFRVSDKVKVDRDLVYAQYGDRKVSLDLYTPKQRSEKPLPVIVVIHGGGWRNGDKTKFARFAAHFAENGYAAACIGYRLLPEVTFPCPVQDCKAAVRWVRANAKKYGMNPERIGAFGGSAGAHLTAMLATSHKAGALEGEGGNAKVSSRIHAAVGLATPADMSRYAARTGASEDLAKLISPIAHVDGDSAPILLMHSDSDGTVPHEMSVKLQAKYKAAGVAVELITVPKAGHAFWNQPQQFDATMKASLAFLDKILKAPPAGSASPKE